MAQYNAVASEICPAEKLCSLSFAVRWRVDRNAWVEWKGDEQGQLAHTMQHSQEHQSLGAVQSSARIFVD